MVFVEAVKDEDEMITLDGGTMKPKTHLNWMALLKGAWKSSNTKRSIKVENKFFMQGVNDSKNKECF